MSHTSIKDSGERTEFSTGAVRDMHAGKGRFDLLPWHAIHDFAKHCEEGAIKYGERNIDKGIPQHSLIDSAIRHLVRYIHNETDEPHLRAAAWNIMWALEQETTHPELIDLPGRKESPERSTQTDDNQSNANETYIKAYKSGAKDMMNRLADMLGVKVFESNGEMMAVCVKKEQL